MLKAGFISLFLLLCTGLKAQRTQVNLNFNFGPLYLFNQHGGRYDLGVSRQLGLNLLIGKKKSVMLFRPGIALITNDFNSRLKDNAPQTQVRQKLLCLTPEVLMRINKRFYLKTGLLLGLHQRSRIMVAYRGANHSLSYSTTEMLGEYAPAGIQAAVSTGLCIPFNLKKAELKLDLGFVQYATPVVDYDYYNPALKNIENRAALSSKVRPSVFMIGLEIALRRQEKPKKEKDAN